MSLAYIILSTSHIFKDLQDIYKSIDNVLINAHFDFLMPPCIFPRLRDSEDIELVRLRADIQDLCLAGLSPYLTEQKESVVGISKHLCGAATDLAIR